MLFNSLNAISPIDGRYSEKTAVLSNYFSEKSLIKNRVLVEGINLAKKHMRPNQENQQGGIIEKELSINISNVMLLKNGKPVKVGFKVLKDGKKIRVNRKNGDLID